MAQIDGLLPMSDEGVNLFDVKNAAVTIGIFPVAVRHGSGSPLHTEIPTILPLRLRSGRGHYVLAFGRIGDKVRLIDFPQTVAVDEQRLRDRGTWNGTALYMFADRRAAEQFAMAFESDVRATRIRTVAALIGIVAAILTVVLMHKGSRSKKTSPNSGRSTTACGAPGVTLLELLVVISIVALLLSLALPAVQRARESQRALECRNRLKQLGLGMQGFHEAHSTFPAGGLLARKDSNLSGGVVRSRFSAFAYMLPYLEQSALFNSINFEIGLDFPSASAPLKTSDAQLTAMQRAVTLFLCPSDLSNQGPGANYRLNIGVGPFHRRRNSPDGGNGAFGAEPLSARDFTDGLSNTVAMSEKARGDCSFGKYNPVSDFFYVGLGAGLPRTADEFLQVCRYAPTSPPPFDCNGGRHWIYAGLSNTWYNHGQEPNGEVPDCGLQKFHPVPGLFTARSYHDSKIHVLMADGAVRSVGDRIDRTVWRSLGTRDGSETVNDSEW